MNTTIDIETLHTRRGGIVLSIGAAEEINGVITRNFYSPLNMTQSQAMGLSIDEDTLKWWLQTNSDLFRDTVLGGLTVDNGYVMANFAEWINPDTYVWGNSHSFDCTLLQPYWEYFGMQEPWKYYNERCFRTIKNEWKEVEAPEFMGVKHNALHDAMHEATWLIKIQEYRRKIIDAK